MWTTKRWANSRAISPVSSTRPLRRSKSKGANAMLKSSFIFVLIACAGPTLFAQGRAGRGGGATNDFYRFNYTSDEAMQRIDYPAQPIATDHQITLHGQTIDYTARVGFMPIKQATSGITEG